MKSQRTMTTRRAALLIFVFFLSLYLLTASGRVETSDGHTMMAVTKSIVERGDFAIPKDTPGVPGREGKYYSKYGIAQSLAAVPLYFVGNLLATTVLPDTYAGHATMFTVSLFNSLITSLTVFLIFLFSRKLGYSLKLSAFLSFLYGFATMAWPYAKEFFSEPLDGFFILLSLYSVYSYRQRPNNKWLVLSGFSLSMAVATRASSAIIVPVVGLYLILACLRWQSASSKLRGALAFVLPLLSTAFLLGWYNLVRFGSFLETGYGMEGEGFTTPLLKGMYGLLLSPGKSVFLYSPVLVLFPMAATPFFRKQKPEAILFYSIIAANVLLYSKWVQWYGGWCWGPRFLLPVMPLMVLPLGSLLQRRRSEVFRISVAILLALSIITQLSAVSVNSRRFYYEMLGRSPSDYEDSMFYQIRFSPLIGQWQTAGVVIQNLKRGDFARFSDETKTGQNTNKMNTKEYVDYLLDTHLSLNSPNFWLFYLYLLGFPSKLIWLIVLTFLAPIAVSGFLILRSSFEADGNLELSPAPKAV